MTSPGVDAEIDLFYEQVISGDDIPLVDILVVARTLLLANYDLDENEVGELLEVEEGLEAETLAKVVLESLFGPDQKVRGYVDWVRASLIANGLSCSEIPASAINDVLSILMATNRTVPPSQFIDALPGGPRSRFPGATRLMEILISPDRTRRGGIEALSITLADGNCWGLALPSHRIRPEIIEGVDGEGCPFQTIRLVAGFGYPLEVRRLIEDLRFACDRRDPEQQFEALIRLAAALVCRAHDIEPATAATLLEIDVEGLPGLVESILTIVSGEYSTIPGMTRKCDVDG